MSYRNIWMQNCYIAEFSGIVSYDDLLNVNGQFFGDKRSDSIDFILVYFSGVHELSLSDFDLAKIAGIDFGGSLSVKHIKMALVYDDEDQKRVFDKYIECREKYPISWAIKTFSSIDDAFEWTDLPV